MPNYSYICADCYHTFELFFYIKDYIADPKCCNCGSKHTHRDYLQDARSISTSVKKSDSELKTIGDLAMRNTERMSSDKKTELYHKHNSYKNDGDQKPLPKGMSRMKKPPKTIWPS